MCLEVSQVVLSELPHRLHSCPSSLTLVHIVLSCGPPWEVVAVCHPPILAGQRLARCWVRHLPTCSFGKSFSTSNGVNSASIDRVDTSRSAFLLLFKGMTSPWGMANRNSRLWWATCKLPLGSFISYEGTPFVTWHITSYSTSPHTDLSLSFSLGMRQLSSTLCLPASVEPCL